MDIEDTCHAIRPQLFGKRSRVEPAKHYRAARLSFVSCYVNNCTVTAFPDLQSFSLSQSAKRCPPCFFLGPSASFFKQQLPGAELPSAVPSLLAGKLDNDPDLAVVAKKVKGYQSGSIKAQEIVREGTAQFRGLLTGPAGRAKFDMTLVKQGDGRWAIGIFSGPNSE